MSEIIKHTRLIRNGVQIPATLAGNDPDHQSVDAGIVELKRDPSLDAAPVRIDAQTANLRAEGLPEGGFQKVVVIHDKGTEVLYQATERS
ncbi:MAG: hypothetical protein ABSA43_00995 [Candidatus Microgenomates bacterium]|jgi:hypothetical protein